MKFRNQLHPGEGRWYMIGRTKNQEEDKAFREWMDKHCPDCMYILRFNSGDPYWEIRGGDKKWQSLILLRWTTLN